MTHSDIDMATAAGSVAAIASPVWLPSLHTVSVEAAEWLPILGGICLALQAAHWILRIWRTYRQ